MNLDINKLAFLELLKAGLWEKEIQLLPFEGAEVAQVMRLAQEQSVVGLPTAGCELSSAFKMSMEKSLLIAAEILQIEYRNNAMNEFVAKLMRGLRDAGVYALIIKGQGIAQCYERPLWRAAGDVDLLLSDVDYKFAVSHLTPMASKVDEENTFTRHLGMVIGEWKVELHGTLRSELWRRIENVLDEVHRAIFNEGKARSCIIDKTKVFLPHQDEDAFFVFTHILHHFFRGGIGLRQVCDWCRLLWTYRESIDVKLLESRLRRAGLMSEWRAFGALAVEFLGMPAEAMPLYSDCRKWSRKASRIMRFMLMSGNMGHNRDMSYRTDSCSVRRKVWTFWHVSLDAIRQFGVFPVDSVRVWWVMMKGGLSSLVGR